jgi:DNA mismatch repair ATPase MutL
MPVKSKKATTANKKTKGAKKAKKLAVKKTAKKSVAKKSRAKKSPAKKTGKKHKQGERKSAKTPLKKAANKRVKNKRTKKNAWKISPENNQSVVEIDIWKNGDLTIEFLKVYRSGWIIVDRLPDLSGYDPEQGVNIFEEFEFDEHQLHGGSEEAPIFPDQLPAEERERLLALSEEELADEGWTLESVTRFSGPLLVEQV